MRVESHKIIEPSDPIVQAATLDEAQTVFAELEAAVDFLKPGPPIDDPAGVAPWLLRARDKFERLSRVRHLLDDAMSRKERKAPPFYITCVPTFGLVSMRWHHFMSGLATPMAAAGSLLSPQRLEVGVARNMCVEAALAAPKKPDFLLFVDDDCLPPWDGFIRLHERGLPIVAGMYFLKQRPSYPLLWRNERMGYLRPGIDFKEGDLVEVDGTGCGFLLVRTEVFEAIERPWFKTGPTLSDVEDRGRHTEDAFFFEKARAAGFKVFVDTAVRVGHEDRATGKVW